jgi:hypothetical protein
MKLLDIHILCWCGIYILQHINQTLDISSW